MPGLFDPETEMELKKVFSGLGRQFSDVLVVDYEEPSREHHDHSHDHEHVHKCPTCPEAKQLAEELVRISDGVLSFNIIDVKDAAHIAPRYLPAFVYDTPKKNVRYYGLPSGQEFAPFIFAHDYIAKGVKLPADILEEAESIDVPLHVRIFVTPECPYCPLVVDFFNQVGIVNGNVVVETIEAFEHPREADAYGVQYVPYAVITRIEDYNKYGAKPVDVVPGYMAPEDLIKILKRAERRLKNAGKV